MTSSSAADTGAGPGLLESDAALIAPQAYAGPSAPAPPTTETETPVTQSIHQTHVPATETTDKPASMTATSTDAARARSEAADTKMEDATMRIATATETANLGSTSTETVPASEPKLSTEPQHVTEEKTSASALAGISTEASAPPPEASSEGAEKQKSQQLENRPSTPNNQSDVPMIDAPPSQSEAPQPNLVPAAQLQTTEAGTLANTTHNTATQSSIANGSLPSNVAMPWTPNPTNPLPPSTPTNAYNETFNHHAALMMALASMHTDRSLVSPQQLEQTVTPSQVTLPPPIHQDHLLRDSNGASAQDRLPGGESRLESFARIEFADSVFQMTTYEVVIGRDQRALNQARRDDKRAGEYKRQAENHARMGLSPPPPITHDRSKFSKSYVSEEGGMLGPESDSEGDMRAAKRRKTSTGGSSHDNEESQENIISDRQYVSHTPGAAALDLASLRPSPHHVPFIGIHSPGPDMASKTKAISREHLKIRYNQKDGVFEAVPLHKNGFFREDVHYKTEPVVLRCGDRLQIKDVDFRFIINGVERGCTGAEEFTEEKAPAKKHSQGGKEMSFDFEQSQDNGQMQDTSDELSDVDVSPPELSDGDDGEDDEADAAENELGDGDGDGDGADLDDALPDDEGDTQPLPTTENDPLMPQMPKKRGPGRPPKNGIMSKREQRLLKKQQQELAKKTLPQAPPIEPPMKRKVGRPRKHPLPDNASDQPEKRKYKPRKPKGEGELSDPEKPPKEKKDKKVRPKSPPLELKIEDYTPEELQKPNKNYGVLIDETLTAAPDGLTLKQIYKRICQRYPWFYFHTETKGWESSVRHNLIGNDAFRKDDATNVWLRVPGVELDAGKKRKASSPDRNLAAQNYGAYSYPYNATHHHMAPGAPGYAAGQVPPGYQVPNYNTQQQAGQAARPAQQFGTQPAPGQTAQPVASQVPAQAQAQAPGQMAGYGGPPPAPARTQVGTQQPGSYSSPYASRPPPPGANQPIKSEDGGAPSATPPSQQPAAVIANTMQAQRPSAGPSASPAPLQPQQQQQQQPYRPQHPASQTNRPTPTPPATLPKPIIDPRLLNAVVNLKNGLIENLKKARNPHAETVVYSALNRCAGLKTDPLEDDKVERICIKGIRQVIDGFLSKHRSPTPGGSSTQNTSDASGMLDPHALKTLLGFKNVSCSTLQNSLGAAQAEAVTLSAIDRVLGLSSVSLVQDNERLASLEKSLMQTTRQLLQTIEKSRVPELPK